MYTHIYAGMTRAQIQSKKEFGDESEIFKTLIVKTRKDPFRLATVTERPTEVSEENFRLAVTRLFCVEFSRMLTRVLNENVCSKTCGEMRATEEWNFLCSAHAKPRECPAIEYMKHTVDHCAGGLLQGRCPAEHLGSVLRRLYRILAHLFFHHEDFFVQWEEEHALCSRLTHFVQFFGLVSTGTLIIPKSAYEGIAL